MKQRVERWLGRAGLALLGGMVFFGLSLPAALHLWKPAVIPRLSPGVLGGASVVVCVVLALRRRPLRTGTFLWLIGILLACHLAWLGFLDLGTVSDFKTMWTIAGRWIREGVGYPVEGVFECRALPILYPLARLFGESASSYQLANVAILVIASFFTYHLALDRFDRTTAQAATLLVYLAPEGFAALGIPSHDVLGLLILAAIGFVIVALDRTTEKKGRPVRSILLSVALGIAIVLVDLQRFPASLLLLSLACATLHKALVRPAEGAPGPSIKALARRVCLYVLIPTIVVVGFQPLVGLAAKNCAPLGGTGTLLAFYGHSFSDGRYPYTLRARHALQGLDESQERATGRHLVLTDIADQPARRFSSFAVRSQTLFDLGSQVWAYLTKSERTAQRRYISWARGFSYLFGVLLLLLPLLVAVPRFLTGEGAPRTEWPLMFVALLSITMLLIGETQPRYLFPVYFLAAPWVVGIPRVLAVGFRERPSSVRRGVVVALAGTALTAAGVVLCYALFSLALNVTYKTKSGRFVNLDASLVETHGGALDHSFLVPYSARLGPAGPLYRGERVFGPYESWFASADAGSTRTYEVCDFDRSETYTLTYLSERVDLREDASGTCRLEAGGEYRTCAEGGPEHQRIEGLQADDRGCIRFRQRVDNSSESGVPASAWRLGLVQIISTNR